jgi:heavy metal sensor kinase
MIAWRSIEYRLTAWYSLLLFATLVALGTFFWFGISESMRAATDDLLQQRADLLVQFIETEFEGRAPSTSDIVAEVDEYLASIREGELVQIRRESGEPVISPEASVAIPWHEAPDASSTYMSVETPQGAYRLLFRRISLFGTHYHLQMASSLDMLESTRAYLIYWATWALPIALLLSFSGGYLISRRALKPVMRITQLAAATNVKNLSTRLTVPPTGDAIEQLAMAFNDMLDRLDASLGRLKQFTADASHELRTPISVIRTTSELALRHQRTDEGLRGDMVDIHAEAQRLTELIEDLLLLARADSGAPPFPLTELDLSAVVRSSCDGFRNLTSQKGQRLQFQAPNGATTILGHESSLRRMMTALLENASEHTTSDGCIWVRVEQCADGARLRVADTGHGIPKEELDRIFDRFYRVDPSRSRSSGGFGLGLSVAKWVAEYHRARISVESEIGKGSIFTILFPLTT